MRKHDDLKEIIQKLSAIRCDSVRITLDPGKEASGLGFTTVLPKGSGTAAVFAIGSQKIIDDLLVNTIDTFVAAHRKKREVANKLTTEPK